MPDISPELAARIEQLRSSHDNNPARFFMPLASAYREAGDLARAEELLRENLKRHPGYLSAHVLLGRCLADRGATEEARNEFGYVLSIDPQNLIALRTLGEMAAAGGDPAAARRWYGELLAVDPMSAEARQALEALDSPPAASPAADSAGGWDPFEHGGVAAPGPVDPSSGGPAPAYGETRIDETKFEEPELMDAPGFDVPPTLEPSPELGFGAVNLPPASTSAEDPAADLSGWGDVSLDERFESAAAAPDALAFGTVELSDDWSSAPAEPQPAAEAGWGTLNDAPDEPVELRSFHDEDAVGEDEVEMVTETMAELYYRQGFVDRAADVYRELVARRGHEPALIGRLAELETELRNPAAVPHEPAPVQEDAAPSWLEAVDAAMAGNAPPPLPELSFAEEPAAPPPLPELSFANEPSTPPPLPEMSFAADKLASVGTHGGDTPTDSFAESFANGFEGTAEAAGTDKAPAEEDAPAFAAPFDAERDAWTPPTVEPVPASVGGDAFEMEPAFAAESIADAPFGAEPIAAASSLDTEQGMEGSESVAAYLWSILSWRPGGTVAPGPAYEPESYASDAEPAAPAPLEYNPPDIEPEDTVFTAPAADGGAPPAAEPWDDATLDAAEEQPPLDEPWMAGGPAEPELTAANDDPEPWAVPAAPTEDILPADDAAGPIDELPWLATDEPAAASEPASDQFAPPVEHFAPAGTEGAGDAAADEVMPWEMGLELPPVAEAAPAPAPAEPVGGFSFEDFFSEPAPAPAPPPAPAPQPVTPPAPAAPAADTAAGDDDEDLESFQAWLQSLKR